MESLVSAHIVKGARQLGHSFPTASPFPSLVLDDFLIPSFCDQLVHEFPPFERGNAVNENQTVGDKSVVEDIRSLGPAFVQLDGLISSPEFLRLLSTVTGIPDLLYDPDYVGGGTHENRAGQDLDPHVDFTHHPTRGWRRRLNLLLYLNPRWDPEWGGVLELHADPWHPQADSTRAVIPVANRCVIFETSDHSWHGFQEIRNPSTGGIAPSRRSFAAYFYTREEETPLGGHSTIYVERPFPPSLRSADTPGSKIAPEVHRLLERRSQHLARLFARDREMASDISRRLGGFLESRSTPLTSDQQTLIDEALALEDGHLGALYEREKRLGNLIARLDRSAAGFPLAGPAVANGIKGFHYDYWVGPQLSFDLGALTPLNEMVLTGSIPADLPGGQLLRILVAGRAEERSFRSGPFRWELPLAVGAEQTVQVVITASHSWCPATAGQSSDVRTLAWRISELHVV